MRACTFPCPVKYLFLDSVESLAAKGDAMYAEIASVFTSVNALSTLLRSAQSLGNYNEIVAAVSEVNTKLIQAQTGALAGLEKQQVQSSRIAELEKEIASLKAWEAEAQRYELAAVAPNVFAYQLKESMRKEEPAHWICSKCFQDAKKGYLNLTREGQITSTLTCVSCGATYQIAGHGRKPRVLHEPNY